MPYVQTDDAVSLFVRDWGEGEPVLFCAAWALSSVAWQYQMISVVDSGRRAVAYDRRGHGRSDDPGRGYDYDTLAEDLARCSITSTCKTSPWSRIRWPAAGPSAI